MEGFRGGRKRRQGRPGARLSDAELELPREFLKE